MSLREQCCVQYYCSVIGSEVNDVNQTGTRHYLECAANLQTKRLKLCLIMFLISPDTDIAVIVVYQG